MVDDYAREQETGHMEIEQDADLMTQFMKPTEMKLPAGAAATLVSMPLGATVIRFIGVKDVTSSEGLYLRIDAVDADPILITPPDGVSKSGFFFMTTTASSLYADNPSATAEVEFQLMMGCT